MTPDELIEQLEAMAIHDETMVGNATLGSQKLAQAAALLRKQKEQLSTMRAVIEAADKMRDMYVKAWRSDDPRPTSVVAFDAARAKLERGGE